MTLIDVRESWGMKCNKGLWQNTMWDVAVGISHLNSLFEYSPSRPITQTGM